MAGATCAEEAYAPAGRNDNHRDKKQMRAGHSNFPAPFAAPSQTREDDTWVTEHLIVISYEMLAWRVVIGQLQRSL